MYHYTESGLGNVWLHNGFTVHKTPYGDGIAIDNLPSLHRSLSLALALKPATLSGAEIRFMRKEPRAIAARVRGLSGYDDADACGLGRGEGGASRCRRQNDPRFDQCALQKVMGGSVNPKPHG